MASVRESIAAAVTARLVSLTTLPAGRLWRSREAALARAEFPAVIVRKNAAAAPRNVNAAEHALVVDIEIYVRSATPEPDADAIEIEAHALLMAEPTLGGLCLPLEPQDTAFDTDDADMPAHRTTLSYRARYRGPHNAF